MARPTTRNAPDSYPRIVPRAVGSNAIDSLLLKLVPSGKGSELEALFEGKASRQSIYKWRREQRAMPEWAKERLRSETLRYSRLLLEPLEALERESRNRPPSRARAPQYWIRQKAESAASSLVAPLAELK